METKREGAALPPLPVADPRVSRARRGPFPTGDGASFPVRCAGRPLSHTIASASASTAGS